MTKFWIALLVVGAVLAGGVALYASRPERSVAAELNDIDARRLARQVELASKRPGSAADVAAGLAGDSVEVEEATGGTRGGRIVLRITNEVEGSGWLSRSGTGSDCYRYDLTGYAVTPRRVHCTYRPALSPSPPPPDPTLPADAGERVARVLAEAGPDALLARARLATEFPGAAVDAVLEDGALGVSVSASGCVFGRLADDRTEVWHVPDVLAQPGELGCSALSAARHQGTRPPH